MPTDLHEILAIYSGQRIVQEVWRSYEWVFGVLSLWLVVVLARRREVSSSMEIAGRRTPIRYPSLDLVTVPVWLAVAAVIQSVIRSSNYDGPGSPDLGRAFLWLTFASGVASLVTALVLVAVAGLLARWAYGVRLSESLRLGFPGLAALGSLAAILLLYWAVTQPLPGAAG